jgi:hypothetical protein
MKYNYTFIISQYIECDTAVSLIILLFILMQLAVILE